MTKKLLLTLVVIAMTIGLLVSSCSTPAPSAAPAAKPAPAPAPVAQAPIQLIYSTPGPEMLFQNGVIQNAFKEITQRTNGTVTFKLYFGGALHAAGATYDGVVSGGCDIGMDQPAYQKGRFPVVEVLEQPWGYPTAIVANQIAWEAFKKFQPAEFKGMNIFVTSSFSHPVIMSNKPIRTINDLKGMKIRGTGNMANMLQVLGAAAVSMPIFEVYDAVRKGTVDGAMTGPDNFAAYKYDEIAKYATDCSFVAPNMITLAAMNLNRFNSLPPDIQKIFTETSEKYRVLMAQESEKINMGGFDYAKGKGMEIITIAPAEQAQWQTAMKTLTDKFVVDSAAKGIPAQDIAAFIQDNLKKAK